MVKASKERASTSKRSHATYDGRLFATITQTTYDMLVEVAQQHRVAVADVLRWGIEDAVHGEWTPQLVQEDEDDQWRVRVFTRVRSEDADAFDRFARKHGWSSNYALRILAVEATQGLWIPAHIRRLMSAARTP